MASDFSNFQNGKGMSMKRAFVSVASLAFLLASAPISTFGQTDLETKAAEMSKALVNGHIAWRTKLSNTGASIQAKEVERQGGFVKYYLLVSGLPTDELYTVVSWPVGQQKPETIMEGVSIGKDGMVICAARTPEQCGDPSKKDDPIDFGFNPAKGEPYRLALVSGEHRAAIIIVPDPIIAKDKDCSLSVERLLPGFELAYFSGSGFPPNNEATFDSESYGEKRPIKSKADNEGYIQFAVLPGVLGHQKGTTTVKGVGMKCSPSLQFDWGR
jgi:hypothetical protein